jgi:RNA polymerase sigma-70 factor (ECF subfamily)
MVGKHQRSRKYSVECGINFGNISSQPGFHFPKGSLCQYLSGQSTHGGQMADLRAQLISEIPRLRRFARGLARDRDIADDLVQDTLVRALAAEKQFNYGNLGTWLSVILININRNRVRGLVRRAPHTDLDQIDRSASMPVNSGERHDILQALEHLSDDQREVLLLVALEGLTYAECARVLSIPVGTVMSRLSRARQSLRPLLGEKSDENDQSHLRIIK